MALLANVHEAITITDEQGHLTTWNAAAERLFGVPAGEALGRPMDSVLRREPSAVTSAEVGQSLEQTGRWRGKVVVYRPDGSTVVTEVERIVLPGASGAGSGCLELSRELSEQGDTAGGSARQSQRSEILHDIDRAILTARSPDVIAQSSMARLRRAIPCERASVIQLDLAGRKMRLLAQDGYELAYWRESGQTSPLNLDAASLEKLRVGQTVLLADLEVDDESRFYRQILGEGFRCWLAEPLFAEGQLLGLLTLTASRPAAFSREDLALTRQVADSLAVALWHAHLFGQVQASRAELQTLSRRLVEMLENERRMIAQELHDEAAQSISSLMLGLGLLEKDAHATERMRSQIEFMKETADGVLDNLHRLAMRLRPASLDRLGLVPALRQHLETFRQQSGINVHFEVQGMEGERLSPEVEIALYRVVQEALSNVLRHAQAENVGVVIQRRSETVQAIIEDDGVGFDVEEAGARGRLGVLGMRERVEMLGGRLTLETAPGAGVTLYVEVPCGSRA